MNKLKMKTSKFHIWLSIGNQLRDGVTPAILSAILFRFELSAFL